MSSSVVTIRMDSEVKKQAQAIFSEFGLDMTTAMNLYVRQVIRERAIPFRIGFNDLNDRHTFSGKDTDFAAECRRISELIRNDPHEHEVMEWLDSVRDTSGWSDD